MADHIADEDAPLPEAGRPYKTPNNVQLSYHSDLHLRKEIISILEILSYQTTLTLPNPRTHQPQNGSRSRVPSAQSVRLQLAEPPVQHRGNGRWLRSRSAFGRDRRDTCCAYGVAWDNLGINGINRLRNPRPQKAGRLLQGVRARNPEEM